MYKSAVGIITCNSEKYIQEVIAHNYLVGFDRIIIVLDQCDDDTEEKIQQLPDKILERVDVFDNGAPRRDIGYQHRGYQTIYDRYKGQVEWLAMLDDDEYFYDSKRRPINDLLEGIAADVSQIALPWLKFTHNQQVLSAPPEVTRLAHFTRREHHHQLECKVFIRLKHVVTNNVPADLLTGTTRILQKFLARRLLLTEKNAICFAIRQAK
jgi:glycosyltransferase involved in cell wall biosynthesis